MPPILENLFWILVGAVITRILDKPIERLQRKVIYGLRRFISRFRQSSSLSPIQYDFRIGKWRVDWFVIEGSSSDPYTLKNVTCQSDPTPLVLPLDRQQKKNQIEEAQAKLEKELGSREFHNGPTLALGGFRRGQIGDTEEPWIGLQLRPSDYYTYL